MPDDPVRDEQQAEPQTVAPAPDQTARGEAVPSVPEAGPTPAAAADTSVEESLPFVLPDFASFVPDATGQLGIDLLADVNLRVKIELGRTRMLLEDVLRLGEGAVVELDRLAGDPVDVYVNDRLLARGEILVVNDNFCVRISEVIDASELASEDAA